MEEFRNQLLAILYSQQFQLARNLSLFNLNSHNYTFTKNVEDWEDVESILRYHFNRSLHYHEERNVDQDCHPFSNLFDIIYSYYLPFMIFIGLVGNLLSCIVFLNTHLKMRSSSYYLAALACADFGFLASLFLVWLNGTLEIPIFNIEGYCQCIVYVSSVCSFLSVWLIAAFTVERFIAVQYPLHRPQLCTVARAKAIVIYLVCISLTVHTYVFVTSGIIKLDDGTEVCEMVEGYREAMRVINIIDSILTLIAPLALIIVMNSMIVYNLIKFSKKFKHPRFESDCGSSRNLDINLDFFGSSGLNSSRSSNSFRRLAHIKFPSKSDGANGSNSVDAQQKEGKQTTKEMEKSFCTRANLTISCQAQKKINSDRKLISTRSQQSITKMLLLISSVFVLLNLPSYAIRLYVFIFFSIWSESPPVLFWCLQQMFMILYYTNFSINFILYSMCGITFRRCLWQLVRKKLKKISRYRWRKICQ